MRDINDLKHYVDQVLKYICGDIEHLQEKAVTVSFPYLFLSFAGIDFLGGLGRGFRLDNSRQRSCWFIGNWMSKVNPKYSNSNPEDKLSQASYLYKFARSGLTHMACVQRSVNVDTSPPWRQYHLQYSTGSDQIVFVHPILFADEFIKAAQIFLEDLYSDTSKVSVAINHLSEYFDQSEQEESVFKIPELFQVISSTPDYIPPTVPTGSIPSSQSFGTQAPR